MDHPGTAPPRAHAPVGIVGAGRIGGAMAARLLSCGWPVWVHDIDAAREREAAALGARVGRDAAEVASACEVLIVAVVDAAQTQAVLFGAEAGLDRPADADAAARKDPIDPIIPAVPITPAQPKAPRRPAIATLRPGQCVMLCPTIAPQDVVAIGARLADLGVQTLEAPTSGGPQRARTGTMSLMLAGAAALRERHAALLADLASARFIVSERLGDAARAKLVNNLLAAVHLAGAAEALALAQRLGLEPAATLALIERSSGQSWIGSDRLQRALAGDHEPRAQLALLAKDSALALAMARGSGVDTPLGAAAAAVFAAAQAEGWGAHDDASLLWRALGAQPDGGAS